MEIIRSYSKKIFCSLIILFILSNCARDLSDRVYTSDSTLNLTLKGRVVSVRPIVIKESDRLSDNGGGMLAGGAMGGTLGHTAGDGNGAAIVGGALIGGALGAVAQGALSKNEGYEYIIEVDTSKIKSGYFEGNSAMRNVIATAKANGLITVVQSRDTLISKGTKVYVIFSEKRTRVITAT
jgi:outer membrane lipoprotein SlyB